jgi:tetratricopeptide (TPR) repeat protein
VRDLLGGSMSLSAGNVVVQVRLTSAMTGSERWRGRYSEKVDRVAGLYVPVAAGVAQALGVRHPVTTSSAFAAGPASYRAYVAYQTGRVYWKERSEESLQKSIQYFQEAISLDPGYAQPWAGLADAHIALGVPTFGRYTPQEGRRLATDAALRGLELDPEMVEAQTSLAFVAYFYDWNWEAAESRFRKALSLDSQYAVAHHWYADYLNAMGRHEQAMKEIETARSLEPLATFIQRDVAWHLFFQRDYAAAIAHLRGILETEPGYGSARSLLGRVLLEEGSPAEGLRELQQVAPGLPEPAQLSLLAYAYAAAGQTAEAERLLARLVALRPKKYVSPYYVALVQTRLGRTEAALDWLELGYREQDTTMVNLKTDPRLQALRTHPRYRMLLQKMRFPAAPDA